MLDKTSYGAQLQKSVKQGVFRVKKNNPKLNNSILNLLHEYEVTAYNKSNAAKHAYWASASYENEHLCLLTSLHFLFYYRFSRKYRLVYTAQGYPEQTVQMHRSKFFLFMYAIKQLFMRHHL